MLSIPGYYTCNNICTVMKIDNSIKIFARLPREETRRFGYFSAYM